MAEHAHITTPTPIARRRAYDPAARVLDRRGLPHRVVGMIRKAEVKALRNLPAQPVPKPARRRKAEAA